MPPPVHVVLQAQVFSESDWESLWARAEPRRRVEMRIADGHLALPRWPHFGWCDACQEASRFECDWLHSSEEGPNFRERLICGGCGLNCRQRLLIRTVREVSADRTSPSLLVYEQETPLYRMLEQALPGVAVHGGEYAGDGIEPGTTREDGLRHEDALQLSRPDASFDLALSCDVYDHVPDVGAALAETHRVLRPGGVMIGVVPFHFTATSQRRAEVRDGELVHLEPPEHRGRAVSQYGALVFHDLGWDLLDTCRSAGFVEPHFLCVHSFEFAYLGSELGLLLCARKPG